MKIDKNNINNVFKALEWKPRTSEIIISTNLIETEGDELNLSGGMMSSEQYVIAVGEHVRGISEGDIVYLDMMLLMRKNPNSRDFDNPVIELDVFPLEAGEFKLGVINAGAVKLIKK